MRVSSSEEWAAVAAPGRLGEGILGGPPGDFSVNSVGLVVYPFGGRLLLDAGHEAQGGRSIARKSATTPRQRRTSGESELGTGCNFDTLRTCTYSDLHTFRATKVDFEAQVECHGIV